MQTLRLAAAAVACTLWTSLASATLFINEFHYDNAGMDTNEGVELAGTAGLDLSGYQLLLYNGSNGTVYEEILLAGVINDQSAGYGALFFSTSLQNGPDGIALADVDGNVLQFISYEGSFTATNGVASGLTSLDIGIFEASDSKPGASLQLAGTGVDDFTWILDTASSGQLNAQQSFATPVPVPGALPLLLSSLAIFRLFRPTGAS